MSCSRILGTVGSVNGGLWRERRVRNWRFGLPVIALFTHLQTARVRPSRLR
jgi:hypothetical protein